jgi:hypothetical protein
MLARVRLTLGQLNARGARPLKKPIAQPSSLYVALDIILYPVVFRGRRLLQKRQKFRVRRSARGAVFHVL